MLKMKRELRNFVDNFQGPTWRENEKYELSYKLVSYG